MTEQAPDPLTPPPGMVWVHNVDTDESMLVTKAEAAAGMIRYGRSLGPGTPACGVWEQRALELLGS